MSDESGSTRVWFITGTSGGFGRSIAEEALARGERVVATARPPTTSLISPRAGKRLRVGSGAPPLDEVREVPTDRPQIPASPSECESRQRVSSYDRWSSGAGMPGESADVLANIPEARAVPTRVHPFGQGVARARWRPRRGVPSKGLPCPTTTTVAHRPFESRERGARPRAPRFHHGQNGAASFFGAMSSARRGGRTCRSS